MRWKPVHRGTAQQAVPFEVLKATYLQINWICLAFSLIPFFGQGLNRSSVKGNSTHRGKVDSKVLAFLNSYNSLV